MLVGELIAAVKTGRGDGSNPGSHQAAAPRSRTATSNTTPLTFAPPDAHLGVT